MVQGKDVVEISMTSSDLQGHLRVASLCKWEHSHNCATDGQISTDVAHPTYPL